MNRSFLNSAMLLMSILSVMHSYATPAIPIFSVPFPITASGTYQLQNNVTFTPTALNPVAIPISASNVVLDLGNFSITYLDGTPNTLPATGIIVKPSFSDIIIQNGSLLNTKANQANDFGIIIQGANKVNVSKVHTDGSSIGLDVENSTDVRVYGSQFSNANPAGASTPSGAFVSGSTDVVFDTDVFNNDGFGIFFNDAGVTTAGGLNQDCKVVNCSIPNAATQNLVALQLNGLLIDSCLFGNNTTSNTTNLVQLGGGASDQIVNDAIVRNSSFTNALTGLANGTAQEGLLIAQGQNFLVDSNVFLNNNLGQDKVCQDFSGIHVAGQGVPVAGFVIRNNVVQGPAIDGIYPDIGSSNGLIEYNLTTGVQKDGILLDGTSFTTVQYNTSSNNGRNGIGLAQTSTFNTIWYNVASGNGVDGIFISTGGLNPAGCPGGPFDPSTNNSVQHNQVAGNGNFGVENQGGCTNEVWYNTAFSNTNGNYFPERHTVINTPGKPALAAENIEPKHHSKRK